MGGKGALNYLPIVVKASIYDPKVMYKPVTGSNTVYETLMQMFSSEVREVLKTGPDSQFGA